MIVYKAASRIRLPPQSLHQAFTVLSSSIHHAFFKPSQATAWAAGTTWHSGFFTRLTGETSPGLEKTSPGLVRTTLGLVAGGSDGARRKR